MRNRIVKLIEMDSLDDASLVFLTGDLGFSVVEPLQAALGERFINMGVAEANMVSVAASLAAANFTPFAYSIAPFITARCFEQIRNDIAYQRRRVRLIGVGSGFSYGTLGPSHHALEDAHLICAVPGFIVGNPCNVAELDQFYALVRQSEHPAYFRIARENGAGGSANFASLDSAAYVLREGGDLTLVGSGVSVTQCLAAAERLAGNGLAARVVSAPVLAPFPVRRMMDILGAGPVVSVFEGYRGNPLSVGVMEAVLASEKAPAFIDICAPHEFALVVGDTEFQRQAAGLDAASIARRCLGAFFAKSAGRV